MTRLQNLSDDEFVRLVSGMLQVEANRRARCAAAVPAAVDAELRAILDKSW